jgi:hypothetical protein
VSVATTGEEGGRSDPLDGDAREAQPAEVVRVARDDGDVAVLPMSRGGEHGTQRVWPGSADGPASELPV